MISVNVGYFGLGPSETFLTTWSYKLYLHHTVRPVQGVTSDQPLIVKFKRHHWSERLQPKEVAMQVGTNLKVREKMPSIINREAREP